MQPVIIEKPGFTVAGVSVGTCKQRQKEDTNMLLGKFFQPGFIDSITNKTNPDASFSVHTEWDETSDTFILTLGYEVSDASDMSADINVITIPASTYGVFTAIGELPGSSTEMWDVTIPRWRMANNQRTRGYATFEIHDERSRRGADSEVDIYISLR